MSEHQKISTAALRVVEAFRKKPALALETNRTSCVLQDGLTCTVREGDHQLIADMAPVMGGDGNGPSPGFFGRAALISCIAIGLKMAAARQGLAIESIRVEVENDWDNRGMFATFDAPAGALAFRVTVDVESDADTSALAAALDEGLRTDAWLQTFIDPHDIVPAICINGVPVTGKS